ncbi:ribokinase, partial [Salmonella enterica subsp. enterica serovar Infantis]|nr:ribokinase [Salmonella enterica subsp. enterica serovar Infantis]
LLFGGANQEITPGQVDETLAHFEEGDILLLQNEINGLAGLIKKAAEKGMKIYLNPSPVTGELLDLPLELVDCFILNEIEGADICGREAKEEEIPQLLHEKYPRAVILLTLGSRGCIYYDGENRYEQPAFCVEAVDTTAAGDTFTGYFIASAVKGNSVPDALLKAAKAAAITVMGKGAAPSIPWDKQVEEARL